MSSDMSIADRLSGDFAPTDRLINYAAAEQIRLRIAARARLAASALRIATALKQAGVEYTDYFLRHDRREAHAQKVKLYRSGNLAGKDYAEYKKRKAVVLEDAEQYKIGVWNTGATITLGRLVAARTLDRPHGYRLEERQYGLYVGDTAEGQDKVLYCRRPGFVEGPQEVIHLPTSYEVYVLGQENAPMNHHLYRNAGSFPGLERQQQQEIGQGFALLLSSYGLRLSA